MSNQEDFQSETYKIKEVTEMKKLIGFMVVLALMGVTGIGHAGERAGAFSLSPYLGGYVYDDAQPVRENNLLYGVRLGYDWTDSLATEVVFNYVRPQLKTSDSELDAYSYRLDFLYNFMPRSSVVPYLAVGGGGEPSGTFTSTRPTSPPTPAAASSSS